ncbi:MAG: hypothetical protein WBF33_25000 [Candidatus Nitrosopolaris sp.]
MPLSKKCQYSSFHTAVFLQIDCGPLATQAAPSQYFAPVVPPCDPNNGYVYVTNFNSNGSPGNTVSVISTVLTPTQGIQQLINTIDNFHLPKGVTTSLEAPLNAALAQLNLNHDTPACNQLNAFLNQVNAKQNNGQLTPQQAADLSQQAKAIQHVIGCSNIGTMLRQTSPSLLPLPMP